MTAGGARLVACGVLAAVLACSRVPEQALRDEQARARRYRDAYETTAAELAAAKARLAALEQRCAAK
ncbi:MAG TPA: hypothetical protein VF973_17315 [Myxococcales bacterium]